MTRSPSPGPLRRRNGNVPRPEPNPARCVPASKNPAVTTTLGVQLLSGRRSSAAIGMVSGMSPPQRVEPSRRITAASRSRSSSTPTSPPGVKLPSLLKRRLAQFGNSYLLRPPVSLVANARNVPVRLQPGQGLPHCLRLHTYFGSELGLRQRPFTVEDFQGDDARMGQPQGGELFIPSMLDQSRGS
jgi:hypothetical protein